jgi:Dipeptidyl aminopeptidases/acylaminoacyl-peptidases
MVNELINSENIRNFAYVNDGLISGEIKGIIIDFFGLGVQNFYGSPPDESVRFAKQNLLHIVPYYNPWAWMNDDAFAYSEKVLDVVTDKYGLKDVPLVACGASMGGLGALIFTLKSKKRPVACITNCPVCDLVYHYSEHSDMPRTIYSAFYKDGTDFFENVKASSPMAQIAKMPDVKYVLLQCADDDDVHPYAHAEKFVSSMQKAGKDIEYIVVPDSGHCSLNGYYLNQYYSKIEEVFKK